MKYPDLYVLRHGETVWNREGRMQGHLDSPLTENGVAQARRQGVLLAGRDLAGFRFFSSPLGRAMQTARIALDGLTDDIRTDDRLMEIDVGAWQGRLRRDLAAGPLVEGPDGDLRLYDSAPGEGFAGVEARARSFLAALDGPAVLVCHGIISRMLRCVALGQGTGGLERVSGGQGNVFYLRQGRMEELR